MDDQWWEEPSEIEEPPDDVLVSIFETDEVGEEDLVGDGFESKGGPESRGWGPQCDRSSLVTVKVTGGVRYPVRREIAPIVKALAEATVARGYPLIDGQCWGFACRKIRNSGNWSNHSWGLAIDINAPSNPMISVSRLRARHGDSFGRSTWTDMPEWLPEMWKQYGFRWGGDYRSMRDAMHFEFMLRPSDVPDIIEELQTAGIRTPEPLAPPVRIENPTHLVDATSLNLRRDPSKDGAQIGAIPGGGGVRRVGDELVEADGHGWVRVEAVVGGTVHEGWVAGGFLEPMAGTPTSPTTPTVSTPPPPPPKPTSQTGGSGGSGLGRITHRVDATSLNLRADPSTSGAQVASLPNGTEVEQLGEPVRSAGDYVWVKVQASVDGDLVSGWVAGEFLRVIDG